MRKNMSRLIFDIFNISFLLIIALSCVLPFLNLLSISLSSSTPVSAGAVLFWPVEFNTSAYNFVLNNVAFIKAFFISIQRLIIAVPLSLLIVVLTAYPLSKSSRKFKSRTFYAWLFVVTMLFVPSLIPSFIVVKNLGLIDTIWALILPTALPIFNMIVMLNFFRNLPEEMEEAAHIDGAGHWQILWKIYIPVSLPSLATITLFTLVFHWNAWFDGIIYMNQPANYPLSSYLQTIVINPQQMLDIMANNPDMIELLNIVSNQTAKAAQLFVGMVPMLIAYPFLQKYFTKGLVLGSVKG
jgi:putative aldouronate transport system permease protein